MRAVALLVAVIATAGFAAGCASSGSPATTSTRAALPLSPVQQIRFARTSNALFSIFPAAPGRKKCGIPEGGVHYGPLPGVCVTSVHSGNGATRPTIVSFTERWGFPPCPRGADCLALSRIQHHVWRVIETAGERLRVIGTSQSGATAPQYYK